MEILKCCNLTTISEKISTELENFFYRLGIFISHRPYKVIISALILVTLCSLGIMKFYEEKNMVKLWIPIDTDFAKNYNWLMRNYPPDIRFNSIIFEDEDNVLRPEVIQKMYAIHKAVNRIETQDGATWENVCMRLPVVHVDIDGAVSDTQPSQVLSKKEDPEFSFDNFDDLAQEEEHDFEDQAIDEAFSKISDELQTNGNDFDPSVIFYPDQYCPVVNRMRTNCYETSLLEMFANSGKYDEKTDQFIKDLTQQQLLDMINTVKESGAFMVKQNFETFLGDIQRNSSGHIIGAGSTYIRWFIKAKMSKNEDVNNSSRKNLGLDEQVDELTLAFEEKLLETLSDLSRYPKGLKSFANVQRSFGDLSSKAIWEDVKFLVVGYILVFIYVQVMLGAFSFVQQRAFLGLMALISVCLGVLTSFGICSLIDLAYGPMHSLIPCLLVGLGVDNAFVLVQALNNVNDKEEEMVLSGKGKPRELRERFGDALRHAGVGVTITSTTDVIVFLVGGTTVLPSLRSYSFYTGVGIAATYFIQITFFTSWLYLDQKRIEENRDGVFFCLTHNKKSTTNDWSKMNLLKNFFKQLGRFLQKTNVKIFVVLATLALLITGIYGTLQLRVKFDYLEFLPKDSGLYQWFKAKERHFPDEGDMGVIYFADFELKKELPRIKQLTDAFRSQEEYISHFESWYDEFEEYVNDNFLPTTKRLPASAENISDAFFHQKLTQFLFSPRGAKFKGWFQFENGSFPSCGEMAPKVKMSSMQFVHPSFTGFTQHISAMNWVKSTIGQLEFPGVAFAVANTYSRWEIDEVIAHELIRNLLLALVCVTITTILLLADVKAAFFVILCVMCTLVDVCGFMYFWGLTIDIVAATNIIISVGLCVDFAAHLTHSFMKENGNLDERLVGTMASIGPAIFHGGISTLLAVVILADSISHVFQSYFKIFFLMIVIGLFHGLIFLPVLLSLIGPSPYKPVNQSESSKDDNIVISSDDVILSLKVDPNCRETII